MLKKGLIFAVLFVGLVSASASSADAGVFVRGVAPVRRVALPPYPVARRAVVPVYRPAVVAPRVYGVPYYGVPVYGGAVYAPGPSIIFGY